jgi:hypothetical protein
LFQISNISNYNHHHHHHHCCHNELSDYQRKPSVQWRKIDFDNPQPFNRCYHGYLLYKGATYASILDFPCSVVVVVGCHKTFSGAMLLAMQCFSSLQELLAKHPP